MGRENAMHVQVAVAGAVEADIRALTSNVLCDCFIRGPLKNI